MASTARTLSVPGYKVVRLLGNGARSTIWQIRHLSSGKFYALKRVVKRERSDQRFIEQVETEYANSQNLDHPSLRKIHSLRRIRRWLAVSEVQLLMEYCVGETIQDVRPQTVEATVAVFAEVAAVLEHMNANGIVHADTKPNNIIVAESGDVKVIDLGQSCRIGTIKKRIQGTPDFISPEQVQRLPLDPRTDVFNYGAALYWTLTGHPIPTVLPRQGAVTMKHDHVYRPASEFNPNIPPALCRLVEDCIQPTPATRPNSMKEVRSRLGLVNMTLQRNDSPSPEGVRSD